MADDDIVEHKNILYQQTKKSIEESDIWHRAFPVYFVAFRVPKYDHATLDLHITVGIITAGFMRTSSDVPSLPVMSLKMKK